MNIDGKNKREKTNPSLFTISPDCSDILKLI